MFQIRYYIDLIRNPTRRDFLSMGSGIAARYRRSRRWWKPHLELSKNFVRSGLDDDKEGQSIAILGAGRLFDVDVDWLLSRYQNIYLVDADPSAARYWKKIIKRRKVGQKIESRVCDITAVMDSWTEELNDLNVTDVLELEQNLLDNNRFLVQPISIPECDHVVSLNLLSQISLYWRDRVSDYAMRRRLISSEEEERMLSEAIDPQAKALELGHLDLLQVSTRRRFVILSDTEFYYYRSDQSLWQIEEALDQETVDKLRLQNFPYFHRIGDDCWLWHLAPQGIEYKAHGEIHRVEAAVFSRINSNLN